MQKRINLTIKGTKNTPEKYQKKPYTLFIAYGEEYFYFSNKKKAERWLVSFKKETSLLYSELGTHLANIYTYHIKLAYLISLPDNFHFLNDISFYTKRYSKVTNNFNMRDIQIGTEIYNIYNVVTDYYDFYRKLLQKNNRSYGYLRDLEIDIKSVKRLQTEFTLLLSDIDGVKETTKGSVTSYHDLLEIA